MVVLNGRREKYADRICSYPWIPREPRRVAQAETRTKQGKTMEEAEFGGKVQFGTCVRKMLTEDGAATARCLHVG
jgi:hypothetical protein